MTILVGGVSELFQGDLDLGRRAAELLAGFDLGPHVVVEDLHYGAVGVVHRLAELTPSTLVLVGATSRGREPGSVDRVLVEPVDMTPTELQSAVGDAVVGYVGLDLVVQVAWGLECLPPRTVLIDVEPAETAPSDQLSARGIAALDRAVAMVQREVWRTPVLELAAELREVVGDDHLAPAPAVDALRELLDGLEGLDREGTWGAVFQQRDHLRSAIAAGRTGEGMDHLDWGLWWGLIEELDRVQQLEAVHDLHEDHITP